MSQRLLHSIQRSVAKLPAGSKWNRIALAGKFALRRLALRFSDPAVDHTIGRYTLQFPFSHNYPIDSIVGKRQSTNLSRIAGQANSYFSDFSLIDIGANVGDTVAELRNAAHFPILAVEGDDQYYHYLYRNVGSWEDVTTVHTLLGEEDQTIRGKLTGNYGGSKQIVTDTTAGAGLNVQTLNRLLEKYPGFRTARMVKIDTDGYDLRIIRGGLPWLVEAQPILFFEYDPHHLAEQGESGLSIFPTLEQSGYRWLLLFEGNGDFMFSGALDDTTFLEEMDAYFSGRASKKYADISLFPVEMKELFDRCREEEVRTARARQS